MTAPRLGAIRHVLAVLLGHVVIDPYHCGGWDGCDRVFTHLSRRQHRRWVDERMWGDANAPLLCRCGGVLRPVRHPALRNLPGGVR